MTARPSDAAPLYSSLADEPGFAELVDWFAARLPERGESILAKFHTHDWPGLRHEAHQLKGAAGSYGFDTITPAAARVQETIDSDSPEETILLAITELVDLCRRARGGTP